MTSFDTNCPIVRRSEEQFIERVRVGGELRDLAFKREVCWVQDTESIIRFEHGGKVIKELSTYTDYCGYLTSMDDVAASRHAEIYKVTPESSLEVVVVTTVIQTPALEDVEFNQSQSLGRKIRMKSIPDSWLQPRVINGADGYARLDPVVLSVEIVWSSKNTPETNDDLVKQFKAKWAVPARPMSGGE